jgi:YcaO-like protein with predicted kinase domain
VNPGLRRRLFATTHLKRYRAGTHRARPPAETLALVEPHLRRFGITRVANVTGLDRIGIPVYLAIRPNARSLSVSQGKGLDGPAAKASAIMESLELHHAEFHRRDCRVARYTELLDGRGATGAVDPRRLPHVHTAADLADRPFAWTIGEDIVAGRPMWVPLEAVELDFTLPHVLDGSALLRSSNGLASGNTLGEAVLHALVEVVERDAAAVAECWLAPRWNRARLDLETVTDPDARLLLDRFERADIAVSVWDVTSDIGVPAFAVAIVDRTTDDLLKPSPPALGHGAHPDPGVALCRALTEAAQSRLTYISGSRDDAGRDQYAYHQSPDVIASHRAVAAQRGNRDFRTIASRSTDTIEDDVRVVLRRLEARGLHQVVVVDLSTSAMPVSFVRVIVPGLEGPFEPGAAADGERARAVEAAGDRSPRRNGRGR